MHSRTLHSVAHKRTHARADFNSTGYEISLNPHVTTSGHVSRHPEAIGRRFSRVESSAALQPPPLSPLSAPVEIKAQLFFFSPRPTEPGGSRPSSGREGSNVIVAVGEAPREQELVDKRFRVEPRRTGSRDAGSRAS